MHFGKKKNYILNITVTLHTQITANITNSWFCIIRIQQLRRKGPQRLPDASAAGGGQ